MLIRTGPRDFSMAVATHAKQHNRPFEKGRLTIGGIPANTPEEADVFHLLNLEYVEPNDRQGWEQVRPLPVAK